MARKRKAAGPATADPRFDFSDEQRTDQNGLVWWAKDMPPGEERGRVMVEVAQQIESAPAEMLRQDLNLLYGSLFEGTGLTNLYQYGGRATLNSIQNGNGIVTGESTWNQIRSVVLTVASQVSRSKPRARYVTSGSDWRKQQRAKKRTKYVDGLFNVEKVYTKTQQGFVQAGVFDCVGFEVTTGPKRPQLHAILATEILIDANDGIYGKPRRVYRRKFVDKAVVMKTYGKTDAQKQAIMSAKAEDPTLQGGRANLIKVYEAWSIETERGTGDGRHVVGIQGDGGTLEDEPWTRSYPGVHIFTWDPALSGPYGRSAAETLLPNQIAINVLLDKIARAQHLAAVPRVGIQRGSKILKGEITNGIGSVIQFGTMPPVWWSPTALSPEVYQHLERHWAKGFESYGVSPSLASGQKAAGTVSGEAIRESLDVQTARFAVLSQRWEQLHLDIARAMLDTAAEMFADNPDAPLDAPGTDLLDGIKWSDIAPDPDGEDYIEAYPSSLLPATPQGRIDRVTDLVTRQIWSPKRAEAALDEMDPDAEMNAERATENEAHKICEDILSDGKYRTPDPAMDLGTMLRIGSAYRAIAETKTVPENHIDMLYKWLDDVAAAMAVTKPPAPPPMPGAPMPGGPAPGPPGGAPAPAPMPAAA